MEVIVEYDYTAEENDELTIKKGDIIKDVSQFEEGWYIGCLNGRIGVFPDNFVKVKPSVQPKVPPVIVGELSKEADDNDANNMSSSDYENNNNISNHPSNSATKQKPVCGIGLGNIFSGQPIQLKQTSLKEVVKESELLSERTSSGNVKILDDAPPNYSTNHVRTRYDYSPKHSDELELRIDDIIQVLDRNLPDDGWWKGRNLRTNSIGIFPDNFVAPMNGANKELEESKLQYSTNVSSLPNKSVSIKTITLQNNNANAIEAKSPRNTNSTVNNALTLNPAQSTTTFDANRLTNNKSTSQVSTNKTSVASSPGVTTYQPNNFTNTLSSGGSLGASLTRSNSIGNSLNNNQPNLTTTTGSPGLVQSGKNSAVNSKWRSTDKHDSNELSKVHNGGDGDTKSMDNSNVQRLVGYTTERPRQTGRRLPTKLSNATNPVPDLTHTLNTPIRSTIAASKSNDIHAHDTSVNKKNITCVSENHENNNSASSSDQIGKSNEFVYNQHGRTSNPTLNQSRTATLQVNDSSNGSLEINQNTENPFNSVNQSMLNNHVKTQQNDSNQFDVFQNEIKQQLRDIRRECDSLKEMHLQLRNDWLNGQKYLTERFQTLMNELDEMKKLQANNTIELSRFRTILMQLDANSLINLSNYTNFNNVNYNDKLFTNCIESNEKISFNVTDDNHKDQNVNNTLFNDKHQINQLKSSVKPSLRSRPIPTYGTVNN
ncbi:hypothetical protein MN116_000815 [Schistosoma mekongi]|uniref:SH3 domain-containing protein n=1 Tax=Schistosoma mekongi TaxID=38744 RepID=A0AAE1ZLD0_SCHME|nr:hypothetical protein MN116_000815 [Schistosoma mekongi]